MPRKPPKYRPLPRLEPKVGWQDDSKGDGSEITAHGFRLSVHHFVGCGEDWFVTATGFFDRDPLDAKTLSEAKVEAVALFRKRLAKLALALEDIETRT